MWVIHIHKKIPKQQSYEQSKKKKISLGPFFLSGFVFLASSKKYTFNQICAYIWTPVLVLSSENLSYALETEGTCTEEVRKASEDIND